MAGGGASVVSSVTVKGKLTFLLVMCSITSAVGGLMFGYEIGIAGGAISTNAFLEKFFPDILAKKQDYEGRNDVSKYCHYDDQEYQAIISMLFLVGAFVSFLSPAVQRKIGRKWTMFMSSIFFLGGTALLTFAESVTQVILGRVVWGVCMGFANTSVPLYLSEMAPINLRGALNILFQFAVTIGIWCAALLNWALDDIHDAPKDGWRWAFGMSVVPGGIMFLGSLLLPNTPASNLEMGRPGEARQVLVRIRGPDHDSETEFRGLQDDFERAQKSTPSAINQLKMIITNPYIPSLIIAMFIQFLQQFTGINAIEFYSNQLFMSVGIDDAFQQTMIIQSVNCCCTVVAVVLVDRVGRRALLMEADVQMSISLAATALLIGTDWSDNYEAAGDLTIFFMCFFIASFAWSWGPCGWLIPTEIMPTEVRPMGMAMATFSNLLFTFVIGQWFNSMMCKMEYGVYLFFAFWCIVGFCFAKWFIPETRGIKLEEVTAMMHRHPIWKGFYKDSLPPTTPVAGLELGSARALPVSSTPSSPNIP